MYIYFSHLPEMLVAAFIKRMARLSLIAPPTDIQIMAAFIGNLLIRHPPLKVLIQNDSIGKFKQLNQRQVLVTAISQPINNKYTYTLFKMRSVVGG